MSKKDIEKNLRKLTKRVEPTKTTKIQPVNYVKKECLQKRHKLYSKEVELLSEDGVTEAEKIENNVDKNIVNTDIEKSACDKNEKKRPNILVRFVRNRSRIQI